MVRRASVITALAGAALVAASAVAGAPGAAAVHDAPLREPATSAPAADPAPPGPVLDVAHALPNGLNLWEIPLGDTDPRRGVPRLVTSLTTGGFTYPQSRVLSGDLGDVTGVDDGSPDWLIVHQQDGGGLLLWVVGGGPDTQPRVWGELRGGGWSWADSRQLLGDVTGDGLDDVVSIHRNPVGGGLELANVWVHRNTGTGFADPVLWAQAEPRSPDGRLQPYRPFVDIRYLLGDITDDGVDELVTADRGYPDEWGVRYLLWKRQSDQDEVFTQSLASLYSWRSWNEGYVFDASRDIMGNFSSVDFGSPERPGREEPLTVHRLPDGGLRLSVQAYSFETDAYQWPSPAGSVTGGGWSYDASTQLAADLDGDGDDELVSVHRQVSGGVLLWAHRWGANGLEPPAVLAELRTGGWDYGSLQATVAYREPAG